MKISCVSSFRYANSDQFTSCASSATMAACKNNNNDRDIVQTHARRAATRPGSRRRKSSPTLWRRRCSQKRIERQTKRNYSVMTISNVYNSETVSTGRTAMDQKWSVGDGITAAERMLAERQKLRANYVKRVSERAQAERGERKIRKGSGTWPRKVKVALKHAPQTA